VLKFKEHLTKTNDLEELIKLSKVKLEELGQIINPILEKFSLNEKEILEVCQVGKFVLCIDSVISIEDKPQPPDPDFIVKYLKSAITLSRRAKKAL